MLETTNYKLKKPELADSPPDVTVMNPNWDVVDAKLIELEEQNFSFADKGYIDSKAILDFNNAIENGKYTGFDILNAPTAGSTVNVDVNVDNGIVSQIATIVFGPGAGDTYTRIKQNDGIWTAWQKIATNKQTDWIAATLQNGWTGNFYYRKNNIGQLEIMFGQITAGTVADYTTITTFPIGFRPESSSPIVVYNDSTGESMAGFVVISATGDLKIRVPASTKIVTGNLISAHSLY